MLTQALHTTTAMPLPFLDQGTVDTLLNTSRQQKQQIIWLLQSSLQPTMQEATAHGLSDEEMDAALAARPSFDETKYTEPSDEDWQTIRRQRNGRLTKGLDKWL